MARSLRPAPMRRSVVAVQPDAGRSGALRFGNPRRNVWWCVLLAVQSLMLAAIALVTVVVIVLGATDEPVGMGVFLPLYAALCWGLGRTARRALRAGVTIAADEIVVDGPLATRRFPLARVARFRHGLQDHRAGNPGPGVVVELTDGGALPVWTFGAESFVWNAERKSERWAPVAAQLNDALQQQRAVDRAG